MSESMYYKHVVNIRGIISVSKGENININNEKNFSFLADKQSVSHAKQFLILPHSIISFI